MTTRRAASLGISDSGLSERLYGQHNLTFSITALTDSSGGVAQRFYLHSIRTTHCVGFWLVNNDQCLQLDLPVPRHAASPRRQRRPLYLSDTPSTIRRWGRGRARILMAILTARTLLLLSRTHQRRRLIRSAYRAVGRPVPCLTTLATTLGAGDPLPLAFWPGGEIRRRWQRQRNLV